MTIDEPFNIDTHADPEVISRLKEGRDDDDDGTVEPTTGAKRVGHFLFSASTTTYYYYGDFASVRLNTSCH